MRRKKKVYSWEPNLNSVKCDQVGCKLEGEYKAPKTPNSKEMYNFCLKHVKIYNKRWDYFAGKSQGDIYEFLKNENYNSNLKPLKERVSSKTFTIHEKSNSVQVSKDTINMIKEILLEKNQ